MRRYTNYTFDSYSTRPARKSIFIFGAGVIFLFSLFLGIFVYTLFKNYYGWTAVEMIVFFLHLLFLEYTFTKNFCHSRMDIMIEQTRLGDIAGNLYEADVWASVIFSCLTLYLAVELVKRGFTIPVWIYAIGVLSSAVFIIYIFLEARGWKYKIKGMFQILILGAPANLASVMMIYLLITEIFKK